MYTAESDIFNGARNYNITQRNGAPLSQQDEHLWNCFTVANKDKVIVCDDGIFSGDTFKETIHRFHELQIPINEIRVVLNFS
jgi:orotate phosphoribosyltransferase-like protein